MKRLTFSVSLTFSESVETDAEILEVMKKLKSALVHEVDAGMGLAPDDSDLFTTKIEIAEPYSQTRDEYNFLTNIEVETLAESQNHKL